VESFDTARLVYDDRAPLRSMLLQSVVKPARDFWREVIGACAVDPPRPDDAPHDRGGDVDGWPE